MGARKQAATRVQILRCFARLASQAGLNSGHEHAHGRTQQAAAWEVTAAVLRNFVAYACARGLPVQDVLPGIEPADGGTWDLPRLFDDLERDDA